MIRTLIVDDEPLGRARIRQLLSAEKDLEVVGECGNGLDAIASIQSLSPDLVFLDVQMPGADGFAVVEGVGAAAMPVTVFVTAYDEFAVRAFEARALDYLLKPFDAERFERALTRAREQIALRRRESLEERLESLLGRREAKPRYLERFQVRVGARITFVEVGQVDWIGSEGNYLRLHVGTASHLVRETLTNVEEALDPSRFLRIHRSTIVNRTRIRALESLLQGEYVVILQSGVKLNSSSSYRNRIESELLGM